MSLINTYSGLSKHYANGDLEKLSQFKEFARTRHLYDPHFYIPRKVNFYTAMCNPNKTVSDLRIKEVIKGLVYSLFLVQRQVSQAVDANKQLLVPPAKCLPASLEDILEYIEDKFTKHILVKDLHKLSAFISDDEINRNAIRNAVADCYNEALQFTALNWKNHQACKELFDGLHLGNDAHVYGTRKEYKTKGITKKELEIVRKFFRRGAEDEAKFVAECKEHGLKDTFNKWGKEKKFIDGRIALRLLAKDLRSKAFKRFTQKVGLDLSSQIEAFAPDKRRFNGRRPTATTEAPASSTATFGQNLDSGQISCNRLYLNNTQSKYNNLLQEFCPELNQT